MGERRYFTIYEGDSVSGKGRMENWGRVERRATGLTVFGPKKP
jgi:hypothetical protein